jgi:Zn-finger nucleic acid-binding protein
VWLDRGELDKFMERSATQSAPLPSREAPHQQGHGHGGKPYRKKKESFLNEVFDF